MKAIEKGDIFNYYDYYKKWNSALQVVEVYPDKNQYMLLALDYLSDTALDKSQIKEIKPFWKNHHFWNGEYIFILCKGKIPNNYSYVGHKEVLASPQPIYFMSDDWYYDTTQISQQVAWEKLPQSFKTHFRDVRGRTSYISLYADQIESMLALAYEANTKIAIDGDATWLMYYLNTHPNIVALRWENCPLKCIDLSETRINTLTIEKNKLNKIILNDCFDKLVLTEPISAKLEIQTQPKNRSFDLEVCSTQHLEVFKNCNIRELTVKKEKFDNSINIQQIAYNIPHLANLTLSGTPNYAENIDKLAMLKDLRMLTFFSIFGYTANDFPSQVELPKLVSIHLDHIPFDVAQKVKTEYKLMNLHVSRGCKPEWLELFLNNPFRKWSDKLAVKPAHTLKAMALYIRLSKELAKQIKKKITADAFQIKLEEIILLYTEEFNDMDKNSSWIDIDIRTEIEAGMRKMMEPVVKAFGNDIKYEKMYNLFNKIRNF